MQRMTKVINSKKWTAMCWFVVSLMMTAISVHASDKSDNDSRTGLEKEIMKVNIVFDNQTITATLNDTPTAQDFVRQLPLTLELEDYASTEKIAYLPSKLTSEGAPEGTRAKAGDLAYYAPWGNMVVFYKDFGYSTGLIKLGELDAGLERFVSGGKMKITIELADY